MERDRVCDHYEVLQVSSKAHPLIITKAYRLLAALYHPDNQESGDEETFKDVVNAYRVLSDPVRRAAYDREKCRMATPRPSAQAAPGIDIPLSDRPQGDERELRQVILRALYDVRRSRPYKPGLSLLVLSELAGCSIDDLQFTLWYLRGKKFIAMTENSDIAITVGGVDYLEANGAVARPEAFDIPSLPGSCDMRDGHPTEPEAGRSDGGAGCNSHCGEEMAGEEHKSSRWTYVP